MSEEDNSKKSEESKDELKEGLSKAEIIESMEKKLKEQEKTTASIKHYKDEWITYVLSIGVGFATLLGIMGVGHIYLGRVRRGVIILIIGIILWIGLIVPVLFFGMFPFYYFGGGFAVFIMGIIVLFILQILDSRKLCKEYNEYLEQHGKPPW